jgi:RNA polymerase sigma-70 factor (ECF subfamily)
VPEPRAPDYAGLVALASRGDRDALDELSRRYEPKIRIVARLVLGPALRPYLDSVDLTQSVHRSLLLGLREGKLVLDDPEQLIGLAVTMLRRKAARHWRHLQRQRRLSGAGPAPGDRSAVLASLGGGGSDPVAEAQFRDQVEHLCAHLDETERRILDLRLEGHTSNEIAAQVGLSHVNVRVRLTRLRQRLQASGVVADWV